MNDFTETDEEYLRIDGEPLLARIYRPQGTGQFPAIVDVHGGGWISGDRTQNAAIARALAAKGIVVVALDFRNAPAVSYPTPIADIHYGIRWLKLNAERLGTRPNLVGGLGSSSGGHQLMCAALRPDDPRYALHPGPGRADLAFIVCCWSVADPLRRFKFAQKNDLKALLKCHADYWGSSEEKMADGNPVRMLERGEAFAPPPALIIQGTNDENMPGDMAERLEKAWTAAGAFARRQMYDGEEHGFINRNPTSENSKKACALIAEFIHAQAAKTY